MPTLQKLTPTDLNCAVEILADTDRGRTALANILRFITEGGDGLDSVNQTMVLTLLRCQFGPFAGSTREVIRGYIAEPKKETSPLATAANCIQIGYGYGASGFNALITCHKVDEIRRAASALAVVESAPGFDWSEQNRDWESVCEAIANQIENPPPKGWEATIRGLLGNQSGLRDEAAGKPNLTGKIAGLHTDAQGDDIATAYRWLKVGEKIRPGDVYFKEGRPVTVTGAGPTARAKSAQEFKRKL